MSTLRCTCVGALLTALLLIAPESTFGQTTGWSVAFLDQILAAVPSGQKTAQVGDMEILVTNLRSWRNQLAGVSGPKSAFDGNAPLWTGGNVYYTFDASVSAAKQRAFLDAAAEWATFAGLHFIARTVQANYIVVSNNPTLGGGQSAVGMIGGPQLLQIGPSAWNRATICHELGHALGLIHEHQRSDRDSYVEVFTNNVAGGQLGNFIKLSNSGNIGAYDFLSVMHYGTNSFSASPPTATLYPLPAYVQYATIVGAKFDPVLSALDRAGMVANYGAGPVLTSVVTNTADSGPGTLRAAIYYAFDHPGTTITFNIPTSDAGYSNNVFNILPTDGFPSLVNATILDASTEPTNSNVNGPEILLNGVLCQPPSVYPSGLKFIGTNCTARGFVISGFPAFGVLIDGATARSNTVAGCYLGVNPSGTVAATNGIYPIQIASGAQRNTVGGTLANDRNVISGGVFQGLVIRDAGTANNIVSGNYIGLNAAGTAALPNGYSGVQIFGGAQSNRIGGATSASFNIISGNTLQGVAISDANTMGNAIDGNYIGLNAAGTAAVGNGWSGVDIFSGAAGNFVGLPLAGFRNTISGNGNYGVSIQGAGTSGNVVQHCQIGQNAAGSAAIVNSWAGVGIFNGAQSNLVGTAGHGNVISGNGNQGVAIGYAGTTGNVVSGNNIGVNLAGTSAIANSWSGVEVFAGASANTIGGTVPGAGNIISGNGNFGVVISGATSNNAVQGNFIGLNGAGTAALGNGWTGVGLFSGTKSNLIGGTLPGARNLISGNGNQGVAIGDAGTTGNVVAGNVIGLDLAGTTAVPNSWPGVDIFGGATANTIGGVDGARNFISGNNHYGLSINGSGTAWNVVQGNTIGLNLTNGVAVPNTYAAVVFFGGAASNQIGGVTVGTANLIVGSLEDGVRLFDVETTNNSVRGNSIFNSSGVGIALYSGANQGATAPVLTNAVLTTNTTVKGTLTSVASTTFQLDFYSDATPASTAEAMSYLGSRSITTSAGGTASFTNSFSALVPTGRAITATATDPAGNTSRLSAGIAVTATSTVNDGIPDAWRALYFGGAGTTTNSQSCATCDADGDGKINRDEFLSGTNPTNSASILQVVARIPDSSGNVASFLSATGIVYRLELRDDLVTGAWSILADQVIGSGAEILINDPNAAILPKRFYRAEVLW